MLWSKKQTLLFEWKVLFVLRIQASPVRCWSHRCRDTSTPKEKYGSWTWANNLYKGSFPSWSDTSTRRRIRNLCDVNLCEAARLLLGQWFSTNHVHSLPTFYFLIITENHFTTVILADKLSAKILFGKRFGSMCPFTKIRKALNKILIYWTVVVFDLYTAICILMAGWGL